MSEKLNTKARKSETLSKALAEVANAVVGHFKMEELLDQIIDITMKTLDAEVCSIFLEDRDKKPGYFKCVAGSGFAKKIVGIAEYKIGEGFTGSVVKLGLPLNIKNEEQLKQYKWEGKYDNIQWTSGNSEFRNLIAIPLKIKDRILGVIKVENKKNENHFSTDDQTYFETISNVIALAIENAKLHKKTETIPITLANVAGAVVGHFNMEALLKKIVNSTMKTLNAEICSIFLEDKEKKPGWITCVAGSGFAQDIVGKAEYKIGEGFTGTVVKTGLEYNIRNPEDFKKLQLKGMWSQKFDHLQYHDGKGNFLNLLALPLKIKDQILGVIKVENKIGDKYFSDDDLTVFKTIANVIALAIQNTKLSKEISTVLSNVTGAVVGHFKMEELLDQIIDITMKTLDAEVCSIFLEDRERRPGYIKCVAGSGFAKRIVGKAEYLIGEGFTGTVAMHGLSLNIKNELELKQYKWSGKYDDSQWPSGKSEFRNLIALPLKIKNQILGVIKVENKRNGEFFTSDDETVFKIIANVIALTIEKTRLQLKNEDQLRKISAMASHRIGNLVTRYDGIVRKLQRAMIPDICNKQSLYKIEEDIKEATIHIKRMNTEFKNYGNPIKLKREVIDVSKVIRDEIWLLEPNENISVNFNPNVRITAILDAARFSESVKELLNNSKRIIETHKGKGNINISLEKSTIINDPNRSIKIVIEDDGPGFPENFPVFEPFETTDPKGTGLGLATVKQNIEAHGGSIKLLKIKNKPGASFEIII